MAWILILIFVFGCIYAHKMDMENKKKGNYQKPNSNGKGGTPQGGSGRQHNSNTTCAMSNKTEKTYVEYIQEFYNIVSKIAYAQQGYSDSLAVVSVRRIDNKFCKVEFSFRDDAIPLPPSLSFAGDIKKMGDDMISFSAENATGFTIPVEVRNEIVRQMTINTAKYKVLLKEDQIIQHGDFVAKPLVMCTFSVTLD